MSMREIVKDSTSQSVVIRIIDSTDGTPETAVEHNTAGIDLWYRREGAIKQSITEVALAALNSAYASGGIEHIGDGYYRLDVPDAAFATGVNGVMVGGTVTDMIVIGCYVPLIDFDKYGVPEVDFTHIMGTILSEGGGGRLAAAFIKLFDVASPVLVASSVMRGTDSAALATSLTTHDTEIKALAPHGTAMRGTDNGALAAKLLAYLQLLARSDAAIKADNATELTEINADGGSGIGDFSSDDDSLEAIGDKVHTLGAGATTWTYTLTDSAPPNDPIADADVWVTSDIGGTVVLASGQTDQNGVVAFYLDLGATIYVWSQKSGWDFDNPDTEVVS